MKKPQDISALDEKIKAFKKKELKKIKDTDSAIRKSDAMTGFQMSIDLISGVIIGAAIGYFLDILFSSWPIFLATLTVLGGFAGILNIYRSAKQEFKD